MATKLKKRKIPKAQRSRTPETAKKRAQEYINKQRALEQQRIQNVLAKPHKLSMSFNLQEVQKRLKDFHEAHGITPGQHDRQIFTPEYVVIDAYDQQDLIIALKMQQVNCENWLVGVDSHFYNYETEEVLTVPFQAKLEGLTYAEIMEEAKVHVEREGGFKTRWRGIEDELNSHYKTYKERDLKSFTLIRSQMKIIGECYFATYKLYQEYLVMIGLRKQGLLMDVLMEQTQTLIDNGDLDHQFQPVKEGTTALPVDAFEYLVKDQQQSLNIIGTVAA